MSNRNRRDRGWLSLIAVAVAAAIGGVAIAQEPAEETVDEVVVTGTFIRSETFQVSSPVDVFSRDELEARVPQNLATFFADLPYNTGGGFSTGGALAGAGFRGGAGSINLRGLGTNATLVLVNGRRQSPFPTSATGVVDVNSIVPEIMIQRTEILKDGASSLYGSDAVAGVVNFLTRDKFTGLEVRARNDTMTQNGQGERRIEMIWGAEFGKTHVVGAFAHNQRDLTQFGLDYRSQESLIRDAGSGSAYAVPGATTTALTGTYTVSQTNIAPTGSAAVLANVAGPFNATTGATTFGPGRPDADCGRITSYRVVGANCVYDFWSDITGSDSEKRYTAYLAATHEFTDSVRYKANLGFTRSDNNATDAAGATWGRNAYVVPGHNPGNPYRAVDGTGAQLYAVSSGISAGYDKNGDGIAEFLPQRVGGNPYDYTKPVVLSATPTVAGSGIPFWADAQSSGTVRPINSQGNLPTGNSLAAGEFAKQRGAPSQSNISRIDNKLEGEFNDNWSWQLAAAHSRYVLDTTNLGTNSGTILANEFLNALEGLGGAGCDARSGVRGAGNCRYYNPFGNSVFATPGTARANTQDIVNYINPRLWAKAQSSLMEYDAIVSGDLFDLPAGPLGVAVGYQNRVQKLSQDYNEALNSGNIDAGGVSNDFNVRSKIWSVFAEVRVPIIDNESFGAIELNASGRHEDLGNDIDTQDPKLGFQYRTPERFMTVRGSYGSSFIAPTLVQQFATSAGAVTHTDVLKPAQAGNTRTSSQVLGNPNLEPQTAKSYNLGLSFNLPASVTVGLDFWKFEYENIIVQENANYVITQAALGNPVYASQVRRAPTAADGTPGQVSLVQLSWYNGRSMETQGVDLVVDWKHDFGRWGSLNVNLNSTFTDKFDWDLEGASYTFTQSTTRPSFFQGPNAATYQLPVAAGLVQGAGSANVVSGIGANMDFRANLRTTWSLGNHTVNAAMRYYDRMKNDSSPATNAIATPWAGCFTPATACPGVASWNPIDVSYSYQLDPKLFGFERFADGASVAVGATNVFDKSEPFLSGSNPMQPFLGSVHDIRGRILWGRLTANF